MIPSANEPKPDTRPAAVSRLEPFRVARHVASITPLSGDRMQLQPGDGAGDEEHASEGQGDATESRAGPRVGTEGQVEQASRDERHRADRELEERGA